MKLFLLLLLLHSTFAKYEHNAGQNDWNHRNIGEIKEAIITRSKIHFLGKTGVFGSLNKESGKINIFLFNKKILKFTKRRNRSYSRLR